MALQNKRENTLVPDQPRCLNLTSEWGKAKCTNQMQRSGEGIPSPQIHQYKMQISQGREGRDVFLSIQFSENRLKLNTYDTKSSKSISVLLNVHAIYLSLLHFVLTLQKYIYVKCAFETNPQQGRFFTSSTNFSNRLQPLD